MARSSRVLVARFKAKLAKWERDGKKGYPPKSAGRADPRAPGVRERALRHAREAPRRALPWPSDVVHADGAREAVRRLPARLLGAKRGPAAPSAIRPDERRAHDRGQAESALRGAARRAASPRSAPTPARRRGPRRVRRRGPVLPRRRRPRPRRRCRRANWRQRPAPVEQANIPAGPTGTHGRPQRLPRPERPGHPRRQREGDAPRRGRGPRPALLGRPHRARPRRGTGRTRATRTAIELARAMRDELPPSATGEGRRNGPLRLRQTRGAVGFGVYVPRHHGPAAVRRPPGARRHERHCRGLVGARRRRSSSGGGAQSGHRAHGGPDDEARRPRPRRRDGRHAADALASCVAQGGRPAPSAVCRGGNTRAGSTRRSSRTRRSVGASAGRRSSTSRAGTSTTAPRSRASSSSSSSPRSPRRCPGRRSR